MLRVLAADLADVRGKKRAVEGVAAGVALQQLGVLLGRAVLLLDDAHDAAVLGELDAAVAEGVGRGAGKDRAGVLAAGNGVGELADGLGLDERKVAVEDHDGSLGNVRGLDGDAGCMARTQALGLLDALDVRLGREVRADLLGAVADDHDDAVGPGVARGARNPRDQRAIEKFMHYLGMTGLHARTLAGGENDRGHGHGCASKAIRGLSLKIPFKMITQPLAEYARAPL